jgi:hypothetical protein
MWADLPTDASPSGPPSRTDVVLPAFPGWVALVRVRVGAAGAVRRMVGHTLDDAPRR